MFVPFYVLACAEPEPDPGDDSAPQPTGAYIASPVLIGDISFEYSPTDESGPETCTTRRHFEGLALLGLETFLGQDKIEMAFVGRGVITDDTLACLESWFPSTYENGWGPTNYGVAADRFETWGWAPKDFYRAADTTYLLYSASYSNFYSPEAGEEAMATLSGQNSYPYPSRYKAEVKLTWTEDESVMVPDPTQVRETPYLCGWPQGDPGTIAEPEAIGWDAVIPRAVMEDQCGEPLSLRDLSGEWVLMLAVEADCDACVASALEGHAAVEQLRAEGESVRMAVLFSGTDEEWEAAKVTYGAFGPVLRDRGYGAVMASSVSSLAAFPLVLWVDPDQVLRLVGAGIPRYASLKEVM